MLLRTRFFTHKYKPRSPPTSPLPRPPHLLQPRPPDGLHDDILKSIIIYAVWVHAPDKRTRQFILAAGDL